jgi:hypothetical protein
MNQHKCAMCADSTLDVTKGMPFLPGFHKCPACLSFHTQLRQADLIIFLGIAPGVPLSSLLWPGLCLQASSTGSTLDKACGFMATGR